MDEISNLEKLTEKYESVLKFWQRIYTPGFREACNNVKYTADDVGIHVPVMELMLHRTTLDEVTSKLSKETRERLAPDIAKIKNAYENPSPSQTEKLNFELSLEPSMETGELTLIVTPKDIDKMLADETPQSQKFKV